MNANNRFTHIFGVQAACQHQAAAVGKLGRMIPIRLHTLAAASAPEAIRLLTETASVHLLLSDVVLPGNTSIDDVVRAANATHPGIAIMLTSGYPERALDGAGARLTSEFELFSKPFHLEELGVRVRRALDKRQITG